MSRYVMLPSSTGEFVIDAENVVFGRPAGEGLTQIGTASGVALSITAPVDRVREILGTLRLEISDGEGVSYFNHRHLEFASIKAGGGSILNFRGGSGAVLPHDQGETLVQLLSGLA
jgi:hypothetical protein